MEKQRKPVLYFEPSSGYGGSGNALFNLLHHIDREQFNPIVVNNNDGPQFKRIKGLGVDVIRFSSKQIETVGKTGIFLYLKFTFDLLFNYIPAALRLVRIIKRKNIAIVHINTNIRSGIPAILAIKLANVPCVCHIRQTRKLLKQELVFSKWIDRFILLNRDALKMHQEYIPENKLCVIYDGIEPEEYSMIKKGMFRSEFDFGAVPLVGLVGRIVEGKGQKEFIYAAKEVLKSNHQVKFAIVGDAKAGDGAYYNEVRELVKSEGLGDNILFTGWRDDIMNVISGLDILVMASSTFPEGFPNVIIEAMALNKPVVATDIPGSSEIVVDGETGFLVPPGDPVALAEAILKLLNNPELARKMGEAGRKMVAQCFDIRETARKVEKIYEELLAKRH